MLSSAGKVMVNSNDSFLVYDAAHGVHGGQRLAFISSKNNCKTTVVLNPEWYRRSDQCLKFLRNCTCLSAHVLPRLRETEWSIASKFIWSRANARCESLTWKMRLLDPRWPCSATLVHWEQSLTVSLSPTLSLLPLYAVEAHFCCTEDSP